MSHCAVWVTARYSTGLVHVPISCMPNRDQVIMPTKGTTYDPTVSWVGWRKKGRGRDGGMGRRREQKGDEGETEDEERR
jgi:hypothetical protein